MTKFEKQASNFIELLKGNSINSMREALNFIAPNVLKEVYKQLNVSSKEEVISKLMQL